MAVEACGFLAAVLITSLRVAAAAHEPSAAPVCDARVAYPPVNGTYLELNASGGGTGWQWTLNNGCQYPLWETRNMGDCIKGKWIVIVGASNSNLWIMQLANMFVPGALLTKRDGFIIDGATTQLIDIIIDGGKVVHRTVLTDENATKNRYGAHTYKRDHEVLRDAFAQVSNATRYSSSAIRITNFLAEYWDAVALSTDAVEAAVDWASAEVTVVVSVGLWYMNAMNCWWSKEWCATRPPYNPPHMKKDELFEQFAHGMEYAMTKLQPFCSSGGRAGRLGCAVTSIEHCPFSTGPVWKRLYDTIADGMRGVQSPLLRYVDVWTLTITMPEDTIGEHQSPMSTLFTWQVLLGGFCTATTDAKPSEGSLAVFDGKMCRANQVGAYCSKKAAKEKGFVFEWECAMADLCTMRAADPLGGRDKLSATIDDDDPVGLSKTIGNKQLTPHARSQTRLVVLVFASASLFLGITLLVVRVLHRRIRGANEETLVAYAVVDPQA